MYQNMFTVIDLSLNVHMMFFFSVSLLHQIRLITWKKSVFVYHQLSHNLSRSSQTKIVLSYPIVSLGLVYIPTNLP